MLFGIMAMIFLRYLISLLYFLFCIFVFLFLTGEARGYHGSRRFLAELEATSDEVGGLNGALIDQLVYLY